MPRPLYNGEGHGRHHGVSGQLDSPDAFKAWVLTSQLVGEYVGSDSGEQVPMMTAHVGHLKGNFITLGEIAHNTALGRVLPKANKIARRNECVVSSLQESDLVSAGLMPHIETAGVDLLDGEETLPTWGTSRDLCVVTRAVPIGATTSAGSSSNRLVIVVACPLVTSYLQHQQEQGGDSFQAGSVLDQEALVQHVDEMAELAATALRRLYSARLSEMEAALQRVPSTLVCLDFDMSLDSNGDDQQGQFQGSATRFREDNPRFAFESLVDL